MTSKVRKSQHKLTEDGQRVFQAYRRSILPMTQIRAYEAATALLVRPLAMMRVIRRLTRHLFPHQDYKFQTAAVLAVHEAAERYIVELFQQAAFMMRHSHRTILLPKDIWQVRRIRGELRRPSLAPISITNHTMDKQESESSRLPIPSHVHT